MAVDDRLGYGSAEPDHPTQGDQGAAGRHHGSNGAAEGRAAQGDTAADVASAPVRQ